MPVLIEDPLTHIQVGRCVVHRRITRDPRELTNATTITTAASTKQIYHTTKALIKK